MPLTILLHAPARLNVLRLQGRDMVFRMSISKRAEQLEEAFKRMENCISQLQPVQNLNFDIWRNNHRGDDNSRGM